MGCGRVGSLLAHTLDGMGHSVAVVDQEARAFRRLDPDFRGITVTGVGFDRETLELAGIERAHAFAAVSSGDNSNILAARVARETYGVDHVVARIYDPRRAEIYQRLGIPTVATVAWTAGQIMRRMIPLGLHEEYRDASGTMCLSEVPAAPAWVGIEVLALQRLTGARIAFITRYGEAMLPYEDSVIQEGDILHLACRTADRDRVMGILDAGPQEH